MRDTRSPAGPDPGEAIGALVGALAEVSPEVLVHLVNAATELVAAARAVLDGMEAAAARSSPPRSSIRRIPIT
jgi:hypothetical protein